MHQSTPQRNQQGFNDITLSTFFNQYEIDFHADLESCNRRERLDIYRLFRIFLLEKEINYIEKKIIGYSGLCLQDIWLLGNFLDLFPVLCPSEKSIKIFLSIKPLTNLLGGIFYQQGIGFFRSSPNNSYTNFSGYATKAYYQYASSGMNRKMDREIVSRLYSKKKLKQMKRRGRFHKSSN